MRISDWSSDVCSSDLAAVALHDHVAALALGAADLDGALGQRRRLLEFRAQRLRRGVAEAQGTRRVAPPDRERYRAEAVALVLDQPGRQRFRRGAGAPAPRPEEPPSERPPLTPT